MTLTSSEQALVSVIIPTYRRPVEVRAAVLSALGQSWGQIEVIVVSDGPHAPTRAALADLADGVHGKRLQYLELPTNQGPAAARNAGVAASQGVWLAFLDDDDLMLESKISAQMALASEADPWRMVSCRSIYRHGTREDIWPARPLREHEDLAEYLLLRRSLLGRPGVVSLQSLLMHRSVAEAIPFSSHSDHEDWAWLLETWHHRGARITFAWDALVVYNIETDSISRSRRMNWEDSVSWALAYRAWISDRAFCSFLATKAALKARRAGDWQGLLQIGTLVLKNKPGLRDLLFLGGVCLLPGEWLQTIWKRSLQRRNKAAATTACQETERNFTVR